MKYIAVLLSFLILVGCNTTGDQPVDISDIDLSNSYTVGWYTTKSEVCGHFLGNGASNQKIQAVIEHYRGDGRFKKGYDLNHSLLGYDGVTNLYNCDKGKAVVDAVYSGQIEAAIIVPEENARFYLDVSWENLVKGKDVYPVMVKYEGRVGYVKSATLVAGKTCDATFKFDEAGWEVNCIDGTRATGTLHSRGTGKGSQAYGYDASGNRIEFLMLPAPAKS